MGVFTRPDSPYWWIYLETSKQKERTAIKVGTTTAQRQDSKRLALDRYHQRMNELAARLYKLPSAQPAIRFRAYATQYETTIALRKGARRERELLAALVAFFGDDLLSLMDADRVRAYLHARSQQVSARTVNREVDLLKGMLRDAVPKYLNASPIVGLKRLPVLTPKRRLLTRADEAKLLKHGDAQDRALLILGLDTLVRLSDLLDLERSDRRGPWLWIRDPKSGEGHDVALSARAQKALDAIKGSERYYFSKFRKALNPRDWPGAVRQRLAWLCSEAKLPYGQKQGGITFHWATRRTGATRLLVEQGVPLPVVQRQGYWKTPDVLLQIYSEADRTSLLKAVAAIPPRSRGRRKRA